MASGASRNKQRFSSEADTRPKGRVGEELGKRCKADVTRVLTKYSDRMKKLLRDPERYYTPQKRPSGHDIGTAFAKDNGGAIPSNLLQIPNTEATSQYLEYCRVAALKGHPARFPAKLPEFFIRMLTDPGDLVLDIFAGSNTTGAVAQAEGRRWLAFEIDRGYVASSVFRFLEGGLPVNEVCAAHQQALQGRMLELPLTLAAPQSTLFEFPIAADD
jgi:hypothetical protein